MMNTSRLKALRQERGYTQVKMQMLTGIDQSDYSKIEAGKRYYTFEQCRRIAIALETSMDYLAGLTDEKQMYPPQPQGRGVKKSVRSRALFHLPMFFLCISLAICHRILHTVGARYENRPPGKKCPTIAD